MGKFDRFTPPKDILKWKADRLEYLKRKIMNDLDAEEAEKIRQYKENEKKIREELKIIDKKKAAAFGGI